MGRNPPRSTRFLCFSLLFFFTNYNNRAISIKLLLFAGKLLLVVVKLYFIVVKLTSIVIIFAKLISIVVNGLMLLCMCLHRLSCLDQYF
jgi:hypothetical protein